jgi:hypothetical protein
MAEGAEGVKRSGSSPFIARAFRFAKRAEKAAPRASTGCEVDIEVSKMMGTVT